MFGGSGYGGFLAILLGVLKIPVNDCFDYLERISSIQVQNKHKQTKELTKIVQNILGNNSNMLMSAATGTKVMLKDI